MGIGNTCKLLNLVKELTGFECLKKPGVISRHRFKADCYQKATSKTKSIWRTDEKSLPFSSTSFILMNAIALLNV